MREWELHDYIDPVEDEDQVPTTVIRSEEQLRQELDRLRQRQPGVVLLQSPAGEYLEIAIGGPVAALQWSRPPVPRNIRSAVARQVSAQSPVPFSNQGMPTHHEARDLLPVEEVIEAVVFFFTNHRLPEWLPWRSWNAVTKQWETQPANGSPNHASAAAVKAAPQQ